MYTNNIEIIINAPIKNVWNALTNESLIKEWLTNVAVRTDWKEGSPIYYTCYDNEGDVITWQGKQVVWDGIIEKFVPHKELVCIYPSKAVGLEKEKYQLVEMFPEVTKLQFAQEFLSPDIAENCKQESFNSLEKLKDLVEYRY